MSDPSKGDDILRAADDAYKCGRHWEARWLLCRWTPDPGYNYDKTPRRRLLLHKVVEKGYIPLIQLLLTKRNPITRQLVGDAIGGHSPIPVLEFFLARGWDVNSNPESTALKYVATALYSVIWMAADETI